MPAPLPTPPGDTETTVRRLDIQGLRAVAVLVVVAFHAGLPIPGGFVGVDMFFVISGFVICAMLQREWTNTGRILFGRFYVRRFKRLVPALALVITITMVISTCLLSPFGQQETTARTAIGAMLLAANVVIARSTGGYFDAPADTNPLLNTWSLSVEEQFYLAFPALITLGWFAGRRRNLSFAPLLVVGAIAVISFVLAVTSSTGLATNGSGTVLGFYSPFTRAWEFSAGALLALALYRWKPQPTRALTLLGVIGTVLLIASMWLINDDTPFPGLWTLLPVIGTLLLLLSGTNRSAPTTRALSTRSAVKFGDLSYSIYLWHWPLIVFTGLLWPDNTAAVAIVAIFSIAPAIASYRWVEQPFRTMRVAPRKQLGLAIITLVVPLAFALSLDFGARNAWWIDEMRPYIAAANDGHLMGLRGCTPAAWASPDGLTKCLINGGAAGTPIFLVGDSTADALSEGAMEAAIHLGRPLYLLNLPGCPFKDVFVHIAGSQSLSCRTDYEAAMSWLTSQRPGTVVLSELNSWYRNPLVSVGLNADAISTTNQERDENLTFGLNSTVQALSRGNHQVVLVQAAPDFRAGTPFTPDACNVIRFQISGCSGGASLYEVNALQGAERRAVAEVAGTTGSKIIDLQGAFCDSTQCHWAQGRRVFYRDAFHLSVVGSTEITPLLIGVLRGA